MNGEKIHTLFYVINVDNIKTINAASPPEKKTTTTPALSQDGTSKKNNCYTSLQLFVLFDTLRLLFRTATLMS